jgi:chemotaxis protein methyltransferase CheR
MDDESCVHFLQWALPQLRLRWCGFRKVRGQVCKRIQRRLNELGLESPAAYRSYLDAHPDEWQRLDSFCRITISRFYRDRAFFEQLEETVLPGVFRLALERGDSELRCWSVGCASGEEPYSINMIWKSDETKDLPMRITATDVDKTVLERARCACYPKSSLRDLPERWVRDAFDSSGDDYRLKEEFRRDVTLVKQDIRHELPAGDYHLILCRNLALTYFSEELQKQVVAAILTRLVPKGFLAVGTRELLPEGEWPLDGWGGDGGIYVKKVM